MDRLLTRRLGPFDGRGRISCSQGLSRRRGETGKGFEVTGGGGGRGGEEQFIANGRDFIGE